MGASYSGDLARRVSNYVLKRGETPPKLRVLERLFEVLFFASLHREEAAAISCRVAFMNRLSPDPRPPQRIVADRWSYFPLTKDLPLTVPNLVKLSQAVDPWGSTLAVDTDRAGKLRIWGLIDQSVQFSTYLVKESETGPEMPGMFQAAIIGVGEIAAYKRDVLIGELRRDSLVTRQHRVFQGGPVYDKMIPWMGRYRERVIKKADPNGYSSRDHWDDSLDDLWVSTLCRLLIGIQRYGHGGAVLISDNSEGLSSKYSLRYPRLSEALVRLGIHQINATFYSDKIFEDYIDQDVDDMPVGLYLDEAVESDELDDTKDELKGCIRFLTSLSRVDGLLWFDSDLQLRGFGVEIAEKPDPLNVFIAQDTQASEKKRIKLSHYGMRHRSMARYCGFNSGAVGFVISQDGGLKAVTKIGNSVLIWDKVRVHSLLTPKASRSKSRSSH